MQTFFQPSQMQQPIMQHIDKTLKNCVHCGMCLATCPSYLIKGDELDSPRGRIYLMKGMFEKDQTSDRVQTHLDRCLSCLSCMTTCPSSVDYMHLIDQGRAKLEREHKRKPFDHYFRAFLSHLLPNPTLFRLALIGGKLTKPAHGLLKKILPQPQIHALLDMIPDDLPSPSPLDRAQTLYPSKGQKINGRVVIWPGCAQQVLAPNINQSAIQLLLKMGFIVEVPKLNCCGALSHHLGKEAQSQKMAKGNVALLHGLHSKNTYDAIISTNSGCGTNLKDYGHILSDHPEAEKAGEIATLTKDISAFIYEHREKLPKRKQKQKQEIGFHPPCSLQHGQKLQEISIALLEHAGFQVKLAKESHICCGSAGIYNILQPEIAQTLTLRKQAHLEKLQMDLWVTSNIGCIKQIGQPSMAQKKQIKIIHLVELLAKHYEI